MNIRKNKGWGIPDQASIIKDYLISPIETRR